MNTLIKTLSLGAGGAVATAVIYFASITGAGAGVPAILEHLVDTVNGSITTTAIVANAPNWSLAQPMATPVLNSVASSSYASAASGLASSTQYTFQIVAIGALNGTTTLSNALSFTTDASTTQSKPETINLAWNPVLGATGYAIYFATSSAITSSNSQYFLATTTGKYNFATSTGSHAGYYGGVDTTAFTNLISPIGVSFLNAWQGSYATSTTATSSPAASSTALEIGGAIRAQEPATTTAQAVCYPAINGQIFYNQANGHLWLCQGAGPGWALIK